MERSPELEIYYGPNIYADEAIVLAGLTLDDLTIMQSSEIIASVSKLVGDDLACEPDSDCTGEGERLVSYVVNLTLKILNSRVGFLHTKGFRMTGHNSFALWVGFHQPRVSASALSMVLSVCDAATTGQVLGERVRDHIEKLTASAGPFHPAPQERVMMEGARVLDIPYRPGWNIPRFWQFGWGARSMMDCQGATNGDGMISNHVIADKRYSKSFIHNHGMPAPRDVSVETEDQIPEAVEQIGFPCVVKPPNMGQGKGVSAGLTDIDQVRAAFRVARRYSKRPIMVEQHVMGGDHRLLMLDGKLMGTIRRDPPEVTGDGTSTVRELVDTLNRDRIPKGRNNYTKPWQIDVDEDLLEQLSKQGTTLDAVLPEGKRIILKSAGNIAGGGIATDVSQIVHPDVRKAAELLAGSLGVHLAGFDYITQDIASSWRDGNGAFIELNLTPGTDVHTQAGWSPVELGKMLLGSETGRIPLDIVVVEESDLDAIETACSSMAERAGHGWASHRRAMIENLELQVPALEPWSAVNCLIGNGTVASALLIVTSQALRKNGLPVDRADRIWNCDAALDADWKGVLERSCAATVQDMELAQYLARLEGASQPA